MEEEEKKEKVTLHTQFVPCPYKPDGCLVNILKVFPIVIYWSVAALIFIELMQVGTAWCVAGLSALVWPAGLVNLIVDYVVLTY